MNSQAEAGLIWTLRLTHADGRVEDEVVHNLIPQEGLTLQQGNTFLGTGQVTSWFIALYEGNYTPVSTLTAATFVAAATETTAYTSSTRIAFVPAAVSPGAIDNSASPANFVFNSVTDKIIYGGVITSSSVKGSGSGVLISAVRFASPKTCENGATLQVIAGNSLIST